MTRLIRVGCGIFDLDKLEELEKGEDKEVGEKEE